MGRPDFEPPGNSEPDKLTLEEVRDCRSLISKLWGTMDQGHKDQVFDGLTNGETVQLVGAIPSPPAEELEDMMKAARQGFLGKSPWLDLVEMEPDIAKSILDSSEYVQLLQRHAQEVSELIARLKVLPPLAPEGPMRN
ncbi:hypothetical protein M1437_03305 [Patescibacteria group bacterium]|nr:hypothetical protein [Patescibacteria group bacterium]